MWTSATTDVEVESQPLCNSKLIVDPEVQRRCVEVRATQQGVFSGGARSKHPEHRAQDRALCAISVLSIASALPSCNRVTVCIQTQTPVETTVVRFISISSPFSVFKKNKNRNRQRSAVRVAIVDIFVRNQM